LGKSIWYKTLSEIKEHDTHALDSYYEGRSFFLKKVNLDRIVGELHDSYGKRFSERRFPREENNLSFSRTTGLYFTKTSSILEAWREGIPLMPAKVFYEKGKLLIDDGNHRLHAALCLDEETVPLEVCNPWNMEWLQLVDEICFYK